MKIKPCPFCGSKNINTDENLFYETDEEDEDCDLMDIIHQNNGNVDFTQQVMSCEDCGTCGPLANSESDALDLWNKRA